MQTGSLLGMLALSLGLVASSAPDYSHYTEEELSALKQIQAVVGAEFGNYTGPFSSPGYMVHVVRARNGDVEGSVAMIRNIFHWRQANGIDELLKEDFSEFKKRYPYWYDHGAFNGEPIVSLSIWNLRQITLGGHGDRFMRYVDRIFEEGIQHTLNASKVKGVDITQAVMLIDLSTYSPRTHACLACMGFYREFLHHLENYYPQSTSLTFLINTPRIFSLLLETLRPLMSAYTQKTLEIYGVNKEEYRQALLKLIPIDRLRPQFGGNLRED